MGQVYDFVFAVFGLVYQYFGFRYDGCPRIEFQRDDQKPVAAGRLEFVPGVFERRDARFVFEHTFQQAGVQALPVGGEERVQLAVTVLGPVETVIVVTGAQDVRNHVVEDAERIRDELPLFVRGQVAVYSVRYGTLILFDQVAGAEHQPDVQTSLVLLDPVHHQFERRVVVIEFGVGLRIGYQYHAP